MFPFPLSLSPLHMPANHLSPISSHFVHYIDPTALYILFAICLISSLSHSTHIPSKHSLPINTHSLRFHFPVDRAQHSEHNIVADFPHSHKTYTFCSLIGIFSSHKAPLDPTTPKSCPFAQSVLTT